VGGRYRVCGICLRAGRPSVDVIAQLSMGWVDPRVGLGWVHYSNTHTHTPVKRPFSGTTRLSRYQKGKTDLDFTEARDSEWQWIQLDHVQVCTSIQTDNHASTTTLRIHYSKSTKNLKALS